MATTLALIRRHVIATHLQVCQAPDNSCVVYGVWVVKVICCTAKDLVITSAPSSWRLERLLTKQNLATAVKKASLLHAVMSVGGSILRVKRWVYDKWESGSHATSASSSGVKPL